MIVAPWPPGSTTDGSELDRFGAIVRAKDVEREE